VSLSFASPQSLETTKDVSQLSQTPTNTYKAVYGEMLEGVATNKNLSFEALQNANPEIDPKKPLIHGQTVNLPDAELKQTQVVKTELLATNNPGTAAANIESANRTEASPGVVNESDSASLLLAANQQKRNPQLANPVPVATTREQIIQRGRINTTLGYNTNEGDSVDPNSHPVFTNQVNQGIIAFNGQRVNGRSEKAGPDGKVEYNWSPDPSMTQMAKITRETGIPTMFYDRVIPVIREGADYSKQGKEAAQLTFNNSAGVRKPGDSYFLDIEKVPGVSSKFKGKENDVWARMDNTQRMDYVKGYLAEMDKLTGTKTGVYSIPSSMQKILPYPLPETSEKNKKYNRDYEEIATGRPMWLVNSFTDKAREKHLKTNIIDIPKGWVVQTQQIGLGDTDGSFPLGHGIRENKSPNKLLDTNARNLNLLEVVNNGIESDKVTFSKDKSYGWATMQLQTALQKAGEWKGAIDGKFDDKFAAAVSQWQTKNNIPATGIVDRATLVSLERYFPPSNNVQEPGGRREPNNKPYGITRGT
jgi:hypothetical protein